MERMRSVAESLGVLNVFPTSNKLQLTTDIAALPVNWFQLMNLTNDDLFQAAFVGLSNLQSIITNMVRAYMCNQLITIIFCFCFKL